MTEQSRMIANSSPLGAELVALFEATYTDVKFEKLLHTCDRCGALVPEMTQDTHSDWHRDLSLRLFTLMSFVKDHVDLHDRVSADLLSILEEK